MLGDLAGRLGMSYEMTFRNATAGQLDGFMVQFNQNWAGLAPREVALPVAVPPDGSATYAVPVDFSDFYAQASFDKNHAAFGMTPYTAFAGAVRNDDPLRFTFDLVGIGKAEAFLTPK